MANISPFLDDEYLINLRANSLQKGGDGGPSTKSSLYIASNPGNYVLLILAMLGPSLVHSQVRILAMLGLKNIITWVRSYVQA